MCACGEKRQEYSGNADTLKIDGSSTVYPITHAISELYRKQSAGTIIYQNVSGSGGGFEKFSRNEIAICNASRPMNAAEKESCNKNDVRFIPFEIAYDGIALVVNSGNSWLDYLTTSELRRICMEGGAKKWSEVRNGWPNEPIELLAPGEASGTYDYFKEAILTDGTPFRRDYKMSENDNLLALGISKSPYSLGFFGLGYYEKNKDKLRLVALNNGSGPILPTTETIMAGTYTPLSRMLYIYATADFAATPTGKDFLRFYLQHAAGAASREGYIPLPAHRYEQATATNF